MDQPKITDFTTVVGISPPAIAFSELDVFHLRVKLNDRWVTVGIHKTREEAETAELAISQIMVDYRTQRNAWEREISVNASDESD